jgi:hypothetical protein
VQSYFDKEATREKADVQKKKQETEAETTTPQLPTPVEHYEEEEEKTIPKKEETTTPHLPTPLEGYEEETVAPKKKLSDSDIWDLINKHYNTNNDNNNEHEESAYHFDDLHEEEDMPEMDFDMHGEY